MSDYEIVEAMSVYGGSFVCALAEAARKADPENLEKLKNAFPEYWDEYKKMAEHMKEEYKRVADHMRRVR